MMPKDREDRYQDYDTIIRDIETLCENRLIKKIGQGRGISYEELTKNKLLKFSLRTHYI